MTNLRDLQESRLNELTFESLTLPPNPVQMTLMYFKIHRNYGRIKYTEILEIQEDLTCKPEQQEVSGTHKAEANRSIKR